jgi:hypothetical protein
MTQRSQQSSDIAIAAFTTIVKESEQLGHDWPDVLCTLETVIVLTLSFLAVNSARGEEHDFVEKVLEVMNRHVRVGVESQVGHILQTVQH